MDNLDQFIQYLKNLKKQGKKTTTVDVEWLLSELTKTQTVKTKPITTVDGGKF